MTSLKIRDLKESKELDIGAMKAVCGGSQLPLENGIILPDGRVVLFPSHPGVPSLPDWIPGGHQWDGQSWDHQNPDVTPYTHA